MSDRENKLTPCKATIIDPPPIPLTVENVAHAVVRALREEPLVLARLPAEVADHWRRMSERYDQLARDFNVLHERVLALECERDRERQK